jgi:hypothetical protein
VSVRHLVEMFSALPHLKFAGAGLREMKSVRVIIALSCAAAVLGGCARYSSRPTGDLASPLVSSADNAQSGRADVARSRNKTLVSVNSFQDRTGRLSFGPFGLDDVSVLAAALKTSSGAQTYGLVAPEDLRAGGQSPELILDGAITGFEIVPVMGGSPVGVLGVAPSTPYWRITVAVELRATDVRTRAAADAVSVQSTIYAVTLPDGGVKYMAADAGRAIRRSQSVEAVQETAVRRAVQKAVRKLMAPDLVKSEHVAARAARHRARVARKVVSRETAREKVMVETAKTEPAKIEPAPTDATPVASTPPVSAAPTGAASEAASAIPWLSNMQAFGVAH